MNEPQQTAAASLSGASSEVCGACGAQSGIELVFRKWDIDIVECQTCRSAQAVVPDGFDPAAIYSEEYFQGGRADGYGDYEGSEPVLRREFRSAVRTLQSTGARSGRLLEIGCAYGFFMKEASSSFDCTGVEVSDAARARANALGETVFGDLSDEGVKTRGPYDTIVMLDCIEHLVDPFNTVREATSMATEDATILIVTGDWSSLPARRAGKHWRLMTPPQHLFFFSREGIIRLLERSGYKVARWDRPWRRVPAGLAAYQLTRRLGLNVAPSVHLNRVGVPIKLLDGMRVVARRA